ncbi:hypothetical protein N7463_006367 [Penicillium fimorum]|uniref:Uncharacterized protein n=1 Tax=Penicillium fimorum TaxID=1882269 RepID=A0A9X0C5Z9_9EURO|nr:hypothetical protein N7463_006367 [Penicillium fimorum]
MYSYSIRSQVAFWVFQPQDHAQSYNPETAPSPAPSSKDLNGTSTMMQPGAQLEPAHRNQRGYAKATPPNGASNTPTARRQIVKRGAVSHFQHSIPPGDSAQAEGRVTTRAMQIPEGLGKVKKAAARVQKI